MEKGKKAESFITIGDLWNLCRARWRWFALSVGVCLFLAVNYLLTTPYLYTREAAIMVREENLGKNTTESNSNLFNDIGFVKQKDRMGNVVRHITSLDILMEVVQRLKLTENENEIIDKAKELQSRLSAEEEDPLTSTIINLTYKDFSTIEAERVLSAILEVYNDKWVKDKQQLIRNTSLFINSRLQLLEHDLDIVDDSIATFKSRYGITNLDHVSDLYLQQQSQADAQILSLTNEKAMSVYIRDLMADESGKHQLLIVNSGIKNSVIESQIDLYNSLFLQMQNHLDYTSDQNPLIVSQEKELSRLRKNILANVNNHISSIDIQLASLYGFHDEKTSKIISKPDQAKYLTSIERDQKVKESLYLYLLQKREENEISATYKAAPTQIIDVPHGSGKPTTPNRRNVLIASIMFGLLMPVTVLFLRASLDDSVRDRYDVERNCDIPFLGEIPYSGREHSLESLLMRFGIGRKAKSAAIVVGYDMLNASNEAFRVLRNNMEASLAGKFQGDGGRTYLLKSTQIEVGKTFVGMNLALVKAIAGERVLFIDADLRQASASRLWRTPLLGLTDYMHREESDYRKLLWHIEGYPTLDVLPAGALPTNPTELLQDQLFERLLSTVRQDYDSIIIDSPSAGILADADIIERFIDCTLFVVRAGQFNRHRLSELSPIEVINGKSKPQYVILNGVDIHVRYGYAYSHKYERSEEDKKVTKISRKTILLNKIIFKNKKHQS